MAKIVSLGILSVLLLGMILGTACTTPSQAAEKAPAQPAVSAPAAPIAPAAAPLAQQVSAKSTQIERPTATFKGRTAPSAAFPFSDEEYIAAGKHILQKRSDLREVMGFWQSLGNPSDAKITPVEITERDFYIAVGYQIETASGGRGGLVNVNIQPGSTLGRVEGIYTVARW